MFMSTNDSIPGITPSRALSLAKATPYTQQQSRARRGLALFFPLLIALSTLFYWLIIVRHNAFAMSLFMWTPGSAALITRLVRRERFPATSLRLSKRLLPPLVVALLIPLAIGLISYSLAWKAGITPLAPFHVSTTIASFLPLLGTNPSLFDLTGLLIFIVGAELIGAIGEELGWRGYMLTRLIDAGVPRPILVSGIIWSLWHWPLILLVPSSGSLPQIVTACIFLVTITSLGCISAQLRLTTGSLWPSILLHAAWNGLILEIFNAFTRGADTSIWTGESGLLTAFITMLVAFAIMQMGRDTKSIGLVAAKKLLLRRKRLSASSNSSSCK